MINKLGSTGLGETVNIFKGRRFFGQFLLFFKFGGVSLIFNKLGVKLRRRMPTCLRNDQPSHGKIKTLGILISMTKSQKAGIALPITLRLGFFGVISRKMKIFYIF